MCPPTLSAGTRRYQPLNSTLPLKRLPGCGDKVFSDKRRWTHKKDLNPEERNIFLNLKRKFNENVLIDDFKVLKSIMQKMEKQEKINGKEPEFPPLIKTPVKEVESAENSLPSEQAKSLRKIASNISAKLIAEFPDKDRTFIEGVLDVIRSEAFSEKHCQEAENMLAEFYPSFYLTHMSSLKQNEVQAKGAKRKLVDDAELDAAIASISCTKEQLEFQDDTAKTKFLAELFKRYVALNDPVTDIENEHTKLLKMAYNQTKPSILPFVPLENAGVFARILFKYKPEIFTNEEAEIVKLWPDQIPHEGKMEELQPLSDDEQTKFVATILTKSYEEIERDVQCVVTKKQLLSIHEALMNSESVNVEHCRSLYDEVLFTWPEKIRRVKRRPLASLLNEDLNLSESESNSDDSAIAVSPRMTNAPKDLEGSEPEDNKDNDKDFVPEDVRSDDSESSSESDTESEDIDSNDTDSEIKKQRHKKSESHKGENEEQKKKIKVTITSQEVDDQPQPSTSKESGSRKRKLPEEESKSLTKRTKMTSSKKSFTPSSLRPKRQCPLCPGQRFFSSSNLSSHLKVSHKIINDAERKKLSKNSSKLMKAAKVQSSCKWSEIKKYFSNEIFENPDFKKGFRNFSAAVGSITIESDDSGENDQGSDEDEKVLTDEGDDDDAEDVSAAKKLRSLDKTKLPDNHFLLQIDQELAKCSYQNDKEFKILKERVRASRIFGFIKAQTGLDNYFLLGCVATSAGLGEGRFRKF
ncbi:hypothetical protein ONE63_001014 [Megalurothrips usitatus]|uniref:Uncharacterized protein n=1 Tax=Megalurothrips usitatus TaxID=439358 RepID=A0AAV7XCY4_9NEOP|nr:hypothetical protein ONE63_001014 [Megalurothrips usitatus]